MNCLPEVSIATKTSIYLLRKCQFEPQKLKVPPQIKRYVQYKTDERTGAAQ